MALTHTLLLFMSIGLLGGPGQGKSTDYMPLA